MPSALAGWPTIGRCCGVRSSPVPDGDCRSISDRLAVGLEVASHVAYSTATDPLVWMIAAGVLAAWGAGLLRGWTGGD
jgi:hypothetical protein